MATFSRKSIAAAALAALVGVAAILPAAALAAPARSDAVASPLICVNPGSDHLFPQSIAQSPA